jgi:cytoplasmic FMR1 interacting protein
VVRSIFSDGDSLDRPSTHTELAALNMSDKMVDEEVSRGLQEIREELFAARSVLDPSSIQEGVPNIQTQSTTLVYDSSSIGNPTTYLDYKGYLSSSSEGFGLLETEMEKLSKLDSLSEMGTDYVHMLYCYRPVSRALPEVVMNASDDHSAKQLREMERKRSEINRKVIEIMRPEIMKLNDLFSFTVKAVEQLRSSFSDFLQYFVGAGKGGDVVPESMPFLDEVRRESQYASLVRLIDVLIILDYLKYAKSASLSEDFDRYKRALRSQAHGRDVIEEQVQLQHFLSHQNTRKRKHFIFQYLCDELHRPYPNTSRGPHAALRNVLFYVVQQLDEKRYAKPDEKFRLLRVMAHLVVLIDYKEGDHAIGEDEKRKGAKNKFKLEPEDSVFDDSQAEYYANVRRYFQEYPVVPLFGDVTLTMVFALDLSPRFDPSNTAQGDDWGSNPDDRVVANYDLESNWEALRDSHTEYTIQFSSYLNRLKDPSVAEELDVSSLNPDTLVTAEAVYKLVRLGLSHALHMACLVHQMLAWKYSHPCPVTKLLELGVDPDAEGVEYERVLRYNISFRQRSVLADVAAMIKSLSAMINKAEHIFAPLLRYHVHHLLQQMAQGDLLPILHRADKRKLPFLPSLLHLRSLLADWEDGEEPVEDYKHYKRRQGEKVADTHPARVVGPSRTQLHLLQCHLAALFTDEVVTRTNRGMLTRKKSDIDEADVGRFRALLEESYSFSRVLGFTDVLRGCADMGSMWFREFYMEKTHCVQFPIEMSLPWILLEHVVTQVQTAGQTHGPPLVEDALFMLDLYNDAANYALHTLHQQHLYNEVEAEAQPGAGPGGVPSVPRRCTTT